MMFDFITIEKLKKIIKEYGYKQLHIHHTWKPSHRHFKPGTHIQMQKNMARYHIEVNGWSTIGQHITVFPDGKIVTGRDFSKDPYSIKGYNKGAFCMEMIGNFNLDGDVLKDDQLKIVMDIVNIFIELGIPVYFHRDLHDWSTCPGDTLDKNVFVTVAEEINNISDWALNSWYKAVARGIVDGSNPKGHITREMKVTMDDRMEMLD